MLKSTFSHLPGKSAKTEQKLWARNILTWEDYIADSTSQYDLFNTSEPSIKASLDAYQRQDTDYFARLIKKQDLYRIALTFPSDTLFLDIETTGLSLYYDHITVVGWSLNGKYGAWINGQPEDALLQEISRAKAIVTFNGTLFDLKFLKKRFPDINLPEAHVDLRYLAKRAGLTGGQKSIEEQLGFNRPVEVEALRGDNAPVLWHEYRRGDISALKDLLLYNYCDVEGMRYILDKVVKLLCKSKEIPEAAFNGPYFSQPSEYKFSVGSKSCTPYTIALEKFSGNSKPLVTYSEINHKGALDTLVVLGIDLVSSEERESGVCKLVGNRAETLRLKTDDELISFAIQSKAKVISIDSPLSIPEGRTSFFDDDPMREKYGITRLCERILKKRGVNSYPCLIQSMQKLTQRGMILASKFRKLGFSVIESYPGAAQDIMNIPRKQSGLKHLTTGLNEFGIEGDFVKSLVTHDELDAITSAIVAHFYWSGNFEGLGNTAEDYMIIPSLEANNSAWINRIVFLLSGRSGTGKTTIAQYLENKGFKVSSFSGMVRSRLGSNNVTRHMLIDEGARIQSSPGEQRILAKEVTAQVEHAQSGVIEGARYAEDVATAREILGPAIFHVHLTVDEDERTLRVLKRDGNQTTHRSDKLCEDHIDRLIELSDEVIDNSASISQLYTQVDLLLERYKCQYQ